MKQNSWCRYLLDYDYKSNKYEIRTNKISLWGYNETHVRNKLIYISKQSPNWVHKNIEILRVYNCRRIG